MGKVSSEGFLSLKLWVSGGWLLAPPVLERLVPSANKTQHQLMVGAFLLSTSLLSFLIMLSPEFRRLLVSKKRSHLYKPAPFLLLGSITFLLGLVALVVGFLMLKGICVPHRNIRC